MVEDSSPDGTYEVAKELQRLFGEDKVKILLRPGKLGLGTAYIDGLKLCTGNFVILMDADLSHHVSVQPSPLSTSQASPAIPHIERFPFPYVYTTLPSPLPSLAAKVHSTVHCKTEGI